MPLRSAVVVALQEVPVGGGGAATADCTAIVWPLLTCGEPLNRSCALANRSKCETTVPAAPTLSLSGTFMLKGTLVTLAGTVTNDTFSILLVPVSSANTNTLSGVVPGLDKLTVPDSVPRFIMKLQVLVLVFGKSHLSELPLGSTVNTVRS